MSATSTTPRAAAPPPSNDHTVAALVLGRQRFDCHLVDVAVSGFGVTVGWSTAWNGDPKGKLLTRDTAYAVKISQQEPHRDGLRLTLVRIDETELLGTPERWIVHASRCCAIGLIAALTYCFALAPGGVSGDAKTVSIKNLTDYARWWWQPAGTARRDSGQEDASSDMVELPAVSVSLSSRPASVTTHDGRSPQRDPQAKAIAEATCRAQVKVAAQLARLGRTIPADQNRLPWLWSNHASPHGWSYRMTEPASADLMAFEHGLRSLPETASREAILGLRTALTTATTASSWVLPVEGLPDVKLIRCEDAAVYFRLVPGAVEILRVMPRDPDDPAMPTPTKPGSVRTVTRSASR